MFVFNFLYFWVCVRSVWVCVFNLSFFFNLFSFFGLNFLIWLFIKKLKC